MAQATLTRTAELLGDAEWDDDEMPAFLDEEPATEVDLLTDGGDEE